jgi:hypothetical protein
MRVKTLYCSLALLLAARAHAQTAIGQWRDHYPYAQAVDVVEGAGKAYCATANAVFIYDPATRETERLTKINALSDVDIAGLAWNEPLQMLLVHYANGNLDLVQGRTGYNMGDIKRSALLGNKAIYSVVQQGTMAYLACGFGVVVVDLVRREVRETWLLGNNGAQVRVNALTFSADSIYAATASGLYTAARSSPNLAAFTSWRKRTDMGAAMANGPFNLATTFGGRPIINFRRTANDADTLLVLREDNTWEKWLGNQGDRVRSMRPSPDGNRLLLALGATVRRFGPDLQQIDEQYLFGSTSCYPAAAVEATTGQFWVADRDSGLGIGTGYEQGFVVLPNGPKTNECFRMSAANGALYVATGAVTGTWANTYNKHGIYHYKDGHWGATDRLNSTLFDTGNAFAGGVNDMVAVVVDPKDPNHAYTGSWDDGVIEFRDRVAVANFNETNSSLGVASNDNTGKVNVAGMAFDEAGNLWVTNAWATAPIAVRTKAGSWRSFSPGSVVGGNLLLSDIVPASNGFKWMVRPRGNNILVFDDGGTIENTSDDRYRLLVNTPGLGGLPSSDVYAIAEDKEGQIWVGTGKGVAVFYNPGSVFDASGFDAQQILIEQDGNVQILLETEFVSTIAVDGANRKWLGTQTGGVYLVSADGREQLAHFTAENSPLPSNNITSLAIDGSTGEVFFGTERGIISYRSDAIEAGDDATCASVYPNPVRETYTGPVAITGLLRDSDVRIADAAGNLVYRCTSLGGQAIWNASDLSGQRVATGVYTILASSKEGDYKCRTKVLVVR